MSGPETRLFSQITMEQRSAVTQLRARIERTAYAVTRHLLSDESSSRWATERAGAEYPPRWLKQPRLPTAFGIFGPRGASKSTVLASLIENCRASADSTESQGDGRGETRTGVSAIGRFRLVEHIVDCSLAPEGSSIAVAALRQLREAVVTRPSTMGDSSERDPESAAFETMERGFAWADPDHRILTRELAMAPDHYAHEKARAMQRLFELPSMVARWLELAARKCGCVGFVVALDDLDLTTKSQTRRFLWSLLDELHQPRLILVVAADLPHLESMAAGRRASQVDAQTARDLLYKAIPQINREFLRPWSVDRRLDFRPFRDRLRTASGDHRDSVVDTKNRPQNHGTNAEALESLRCLLEGHAEVAPITGQVFELLPPFPRGLENLYEGLWDATAASQEKELALHTLKGLTELLSFLAEGRGEVALGRAILCQPVEEWARAMVWARDTPPTEAWQRLVASAFEGLPLVELRPTASPLPLEEVSGGDAYRWVELLLDIALRKGALAPWELIERFPPLGYHLGLARIQSEVDRETLGRELSTPGPAVFLEFTWTSWIWPRSGDGSVAPVSGDTGAMSLFRALSHQRKWWPAEVLGGLWVVRSTIERAVASDSRRVHRDLLNGPARALDFLPRTVRGLIVFADSLAQAPWTALSAGQQGRSFREDVIFCAAFVRAAFVHALMRRFKAINRPKDDTNQLTLDVSEEDGWWVGALTGDRLDVVEWVAEDLEGGLQRLAGARTPVIRRVRKGGAEGGGSADFADPLFRELERCLGAYMTSPLLKGLVHGGGGGAEE